MELARDLRDALDDAVAGIAVRDLTAAVERLIDQYRSGAEPAEPILRSGTEVAAYAAYRMPATFAAVRAVLGQVAAAGLRPRTQLDLGGGTGAAAWAAAEAFDTLESVTVLDQVADALDWGARLAASAPAPVLRTAIWRQAGVRSAYPTADLVTVSYVLGELSEPDQADVVRRTAAAASTVVIVEPGTPAGYQRVLAARSVLLELGLSVVAPCPHQRPCPLPAGDWCHFGVRVNRSSLHRRIKQAELGYEDEKFSYVAAVHAPPVSGPARVLRRPQARKGLVTLRLCAPNGSTTTELVSKRQGELYRSARDAAWGDAWPPAERT